MYFKQTAIAVLDAEKRVLDWTWYLSRPTNQVATWQPHDRNYVEPGASGPFEPFWSQPVYDTRLLVVDGDDTIRRRARAFFEELHKKSTAQSSPIYNLLRDVVSRLSAARRGPVTPVVEEAPSSPKKTLRFSVAPSPIQNEAAKKLRFSVAPSPPKKRVSILDEKDETLSAVDFQAIMGFLLNFVLTRRLFLRFSELQYHEDGVNMTPSTRAHERLRSFATRSFDAGHDGDVPAL